MPDGGGDLPTKIPRSVKGLFHLFEVEIMKTDSGAQAIRVTGIDGEGNPMGVRSDGARMAFKAVDPNAFQRRAVNVTPTTIHKYYFFGVLGSLADVRIQAAEKFQEVFHDAGLTPKVGGNYGVPGGGGEEITDKQAKARKWWNKAVQAIGKRHQNEVIMVVVYDAPMTDSQHLLAGLDRLANFYRLATNDI